MSYKSSTCLNTADASLAQWFGLGEAGSGVVVPYFAPLGLGYLSQQLGAAADGSPPPSLHCC